jgi:hypothetical protein
MSRFCSCFSAFLFSLLLSVSSFAAEPAPSSPPATPPASKDALLNRAYRCGERGAAFVFANGAFAAKIEYSPGVFVNIQAKIVETALGAATLDGQPGAAVVYTYTTGDQSVYYVLTLLTPKDAGFTDAACTELGDRIQLKSLTLDNGRILVDFMGHGPNDAPDAPLSPQSLRFSLKGDALVETK